MLSNATSTAWSNHHERKVVAARSLALRKVRCFGMAPDHRKGRQGKENERSRALHAGSSERGAGKKGRSRKGSRKVDAHSRQRITPSSRKGLAGAYQPGAIARVGAFRHRWEPRHGGNGEAHMGGGAHAARNKSDES